MKPPYTTLAVVGPTASGKSSLGITLARELDGEVVNVDSVQVYRHLDVGSAKVLIEERQGVPHHLLDLREPNHLLNVGEFRSCAVDTLIDITSRGKLPVLVGGSTMYLTVLLHGLAEVPPTTREVRDAVAALSKEERYAELRQVDPVTAQRLHINDTQRVTRALEIARITGRAPSEIVKDHQFASREVVSLMIVLCRDRDDLYERINLRASQMIEQGIIEETEKVLQRFGDVSALDTLGYKQARDYLRGAIPREEIASEIALHTRRYAKRQMTYLRNEPLKRGWIVKPGAQEEAKEIVGFSGAPGRAQEKVKGFRAYSMSEEQLISNVRDRLLQPLNATEVWYVELVP